MGMIEVSIVHDAAGRIVAIARPSADAKVTVLGGSGEAVLHAEIDEDQIADLISTRRVDVGNGQLVGSNS